MPHCMPLLDRPRSAWIFGAAMATIVWSMNVMATAKIIAVRISGLDPLPVTGLLPALIAPSFVRRPAGRNLSVRPAGMSGHQSDDYGPGPHQEPSARRCPEGA